MKSVRHSFQVGVGAVLLSFCVSCAVPSGDDPAQSPPPKPKEGLAAIDPCSILASADIQEFGLEAPGESVDAAPGQPACDYFGDQFGVAVAKNQAETVDSYAKNPEWASYERTSVSGRPAAQAIAKEATNSRMCNTIFDAGGGVIVVTAQEVRPGDLDECAQSTKIAERIAPRMPQ